METSRILRLTALTLLISGSAFASPWRGTIEDRVADATALERLRWERRTWSAADGAQKPAFETAVPADVIRRKVDDVMRGSNLLASRYGRPITTEELRLELSRIVRGTKDPDALRAMFAALDDDPVRIAEAIARPIVVDRVLRAVYASDRAFHEPARSAAQSALALASSAANWRPAGADYRESRFIRGSEGWGTLVASLAHGRLRVPAAHSAKPGAPIATAALEALPIGRWSPPQEEATAWVAWKLLEKSPDAIRIAVATWPKATFESWWAAARDASAPDLPAVVDPGPLPSITPSTACAPDTWTRMDPNFPDARADYSMIWTGTDVIVWGGVEATYLGDGWKYNPATDTWTRISDAGAPSARYMHLAVWTGTEMIVWGGIDPGTPSNLPATGGRYNPSTDSWTTTAPGPSWRFGAAAVWSGSQMIVWGGEDGGGGPLANGGRYSPSSNTWASMSTVGAPSARMRHTAVWTGSEMLIWGGYGANAVCDPVGGLYKPANDSWSTTKLQGAPEGRYYHSTVWTGSEMIVWGGYGASGADLNTGARYKPTNDQWTAVTVTGAPTARDNAIAVWTGTRMLVWGGFDVNGLTLSGGSYDPAGGTWQSMATAGAPNNSGGGVWTGTRMIAWGGSGPYGLSSAGGRYDPATNSWSGMSSTWRPGPRRRHAAIWTGAEMLVWGGYPGGIFPQLDAGRFDPATDTWTPMSQVGAPADRWNPSAVWSGVEMIVWGGSVFNPAQGNEIPTNGGGRYRPALEQWSSLATTGQPSPRSAHATVWTGSEMIVWGGQTAADASIGDGARYRPSTDTWSPMSAIDAPAARHHHAAVWDGREMIVAEGIGYPGGLPGGARYDPGLDTWTLNSSTGAQRRKGGIAKWSGSELINALGSDGSNHGNTGERYNPTSDMWTALAPLDTELAISSGREGDWTCGRLMAWAFDPTAGNHGRMYDPSSNSWSATSVVGAPLGIYDAAPVSDGTRLITFGGGQSWESSTGGAYCACSAPPAIATPFVFVDKTTLGHRVAWYLQPEAAAYDVVRGELLALRSTGGDFAASITTCVANDLAASNIIDASVPSIGNGYFYVARSVRDGQVSTYDSGSPRQVGSRDSEIAASGAACP